MSDLPLSQHHCVQAKWSVNQETYSFNELQFELIK